MNVSWFRLTSIRIDNEDQPCAKTLCFHKINKQNKRTIKIDTSVLEKGVLNSVFGKYSWREETEKRDRVSFRFSYFSSLSFYFGSVAYLLISAVLAWLGYTCSISVCISTGGKGILEKSHRSVEAIVVRRPQYQRRSTGITSRQRTTSQPPQRRPMLYTLTMSGYWILIQWPLQNRKMTRPVSGGWYCMSQNPAQ